MGKYIKYFENESAFAEWLNFGEKAEGPDGAPSASVAYVGSIDTLFYDNSDVSQYELLFQPQSSEIEATSETVTFDVKTGVYWLDVYHNGELVGEYGPGDDTNYDYSVDANMTPLTVDELFTGMWYKDNNGEKGEYIQNWDRFVTHEPDPYADPVKLQFAAGFTTDGQNPTVLGNYSFLSGATSIILESDPDPIDISSEVYEENGNMMYHFSAESETEFVVHFDFETERLGMFSPYFQNSEASWLDISTNYENLGQRLVFAIYSSIMNNSTISEVDLGEGMIFVSGVAFYGANVNYIYVAGENRLPNVGGQLSGLQANGTFEAVSRDAVNFQNWVDAVPSGWEILPAPEPPQPTGDTVTAVCYFTYEKGGNPIQRVSGRGGWDSVYINGDPSNQLPDDTYEVDWSDYGIGDFTITYERSGDDLVLQAWLQNSDMVRCEISGTTSWGMWGSEQDPPYSNTFSGCTALTEVTLDANCVKVGDNSFTDCSAIEHIYCYAATAPTISGGNQFTTLPTQNGSVYVPSGADYSTWATALGVNWGISDIL